MILSTLLALTLGASTADTIALAEGCHSTLYLDSRGYPTIGIGHLVCGADNFNGKTLTPLQIELLFSLDLAKANAIAESLDGYSDASPKVQAVVVEMCFVLGKAGVHKFKLFLLRLQAHDSQGMAQELLNSQWHIQCRTRVNRLANSLLYP